MQQLADGCVRPPKRPISASPPAQKSPDTLLVQVTNAEPTALQPEAELRDQEDLLVNARRRVACIYVGSDEAVHVLPERARAHDTRRLGSNEQLLHDVSSVPTHLGRPEEQVRIMPSGSSGTAANAGERAVERRLASA
jgi:hypothetical protein